MIYRYTPDRKGKHPQAHLREFAGTALQADAYAGYNAIYEHRNISEVGCWMHARRKFFELHKSSGSPACEHALWEIARLYEIEDGIRGKPAAIRQVARQDMAKPILNGLYQWMQATLARTGRKEPSADAVRYTLTLWTALTRYLDDGLLEIDNGPAERALRGVALGRKNYSLLAEMLAASAQQASIVCLKPLSSTALNPKPICTRC